MEMKPKYNPQEVEAGRYQKWLDQELFKPSDHSDKPTYTIVIPPPNVTGKLHLGHAWDTTLQDILTRMKRMQGYETLYLPGMDHAGIATQAKVEAKMREEGISRHDIGREKFLEKAWEWKEEYASFIRQQWAKLGLGLDYSRERFTLDSGLSQAVRKVFVDMYNKGLIYRGERIINWDPAARTALSDIEVVHEDVNGKFYHFKYPFADGEGYMEIATTRPETMLGDTAIVVNPDDERYQDVIGKTVILPVVGRELPIIADDYVDKEFGSGAMKVTPAHDPNDFEIGNRHNLERIVVMDEAGRMNAEAGKYEGMDRFECRKQLVKDLLEEGLVIKIDDHVHSVGHSERSGAVVEPYLSTQWFVKMAPLAEQALNNQKTNGRIEFVPPRFEKTFNRWMEEIRDWTISRQLWWGHQIPAWYHNETGELYVGEEAPVDIENWTQDEDVLDTWFSSALWPFSTLGWPNEDAADYQRFYPTNVLVTGYDIIFFWVARMIFQGLEFTGQKPFNDVLLHGLVRAEDGRKMSKSLGNGVDPMDVIDQYGADSLRYFLATGSSPGHDLRYSTEKVESVWNFINKIWNAARFSLMNIGDSFKFEDINLSSDLSVADQWILTRLNETIDTVTQLSDKYEFGEVGRVLYNFIWDEFCDWYIEMSKIPMNGDDEVQKNVTRSVLSYALDRIMRLLHPFMPFVTEHIWQNLPHEGESIVTSAWPTVDASLVFEESKDVMEQLVEIIKAVRQSRLEVNTPLSKEIPIKIQAKNETIQQLLKTNQHYLERFCNPSTLEIETQIDIPDKAMTTVVAAGEVILPIEGLIDMDKELERLEKDLQKWQKELDRVNKKLSNENFVNKAPEHVINEEKEKQVKYQEKYDGVKARIEQLKA
ncbi:valine--tRNA ligase [Staphylococcus pseudintermedius]|uniref:Valine--tRNA ligase n=13 Tax=Staphylococcus pseudintermedius TaxID=283734 RepID=A0A166PBC6_STAPS|nr:valine--tRNA ligase [Staphylococcus pseudintermedius]ADV05948.1 Valyl-tRNA synthetase [Staphylococcus pseudintermedius HKU10-03]ADX76410.1 valyl-tRNA synthetase [Staphylococcus pseudintermedius ED99]ANQ88116.1 valine--tRNA ligase [Staphylococcus pseudintermedius]ANS89345.1 Valyl-tRNA synthetase [Staphylococcus pseudintermedius]ASQ50423.1 valine--tRNA ligase [Staphylococcus pseudintermedius]